MGSSLHVNASLSGFMDRTRWVTGSTVAHLLSYLWGVSTDANVRPAHRYLIAEKEQKKASQMHLIEVRNCQSNQRLA